MSRRARLGKQIDGSFGVRVAVAGADAASVDPDSAYLTFNSDWTDTVELHQIGVVSYAASGVKGYNGSGSVNFNRGYGALYTSLGYRPFVEIRRFTTSNVVYDDYWNSTQTAGAVCTIFRDCFRADSPSSTDKVFYVVYKLPAPQQGNTF